VGVPTPTGKRPYRFRLQRVGQYLNPIMLNQREKAKDLAEELTKANSKTAQKLVSLAYMEKPYETLKAREKDTTASRQEIVDMALEKQRHYDTVRKAKVAEQKSFTRLWEERKARNAQRHADTADKNFSFSNMSRANLQGNDLTKSQFVGSNLKDTLLTNANVTQTNFTDAKNLTVPQLLKARNTQSLVIDKDRLNQIVQKIQANQRMSLQDKKALLPTEYLSKPLRQPVLNAAVSKTLNLPLLARLNPKWVFTPKGEPYVFPQKV
jgi:Pentapeptide repeats (8 copies)